MRVTIFGATGGTGRQLVEQALAAGHEVAAVVRDPAGLALRHERLTVYEADVHDPASIEEALSGADAVFSALGPRGRKAAGVCSAGIRSILKASSATGVRRVLAVSATPVGEVAEGDSLVYRLALRPVIRRVLKDVYADLAVMEDVLRDSGLDWTVMRPPQLTDKPRTGRYRTVVGRNVTRGYRISRADLADAMLAIVDDADTFGEVIGIAY